MILFSDSVEGLQRKLNARHECSKSWDLTVNIKKTKIVIFRKSAKINENERFYIGECDLVFVDSFDYLGLCFYYNGRYTQAEKNRYHRRHEKLCLHCIKMLRMFI